MTQYIVQYELPVDNPENNVRMAKSKDLLTFFVPLNHPEAHNMGFQDLLAAWELGGKLAISTPSNKRNSKLYLTIKDKPGNIPAT